MAARYNDDLKILDSEAAEVSEKGLTFTSQF